MKKGWEEKKLGAVLIKTETINPASKPNNEFLYIDVSSVNNETLEIESATLLKGKDAPSRARKLVKTDDVIFATVRPTLKRIATISAEYNNQVCSTGYFVLRGKDTIHNRLLFYFLQTENFFTNMTKLQKGASYPAVTDCDVREQIISYPKSIPEQKRIVAILDQAFSGISRAKEIAEKNLANAREVFESYLESVFANPGEGWEVRTLAEVCEISSKLVDPREEQHANKYHIGGANIESITGRLLDLKTAKEENLISGKFIFDNSMVLYSKIRPYLIKVARPEFTGLCSADIYPLKPIPSKTCKDFLYYLLLSKTFTLFAIGGSDRAGMPKVNREHLFSYSTNFPSPLEQKRIVAKLEALSTETKKLESIYRQKLASLDELKKSILQKAFSGELTGTAS